MNHKKKGFYSFKGIFLEIDIKACDRLVSAIDEEFILSLREEIASLNRVLYDRFVTAKVAIEDRESANPPLRYERANYDDDLELLDYDPIPSESLPFEYEVALISETNVRTNVGTSSETEANLPRIEVLSEPTRTSPETSPETSPHGTTKEIKKTNKPKA